MLVNPLPALLRLIFSLLLLALLFGYGAGLSSQPVTMLLIERHQPPSWQHWFGTDQMGRDLWLLVFQGAYASLWLGLSTALASGVLALLMAALSHRHPITKQAVQWLIDGLLALPHMMLLILICFSAGGGMQAVVLALALTHWPKLSLLLQALLEQIEHSDYVAQSRSQGMGWLRCWRCHFWPGLLPQWLIGSLLMFPHAVLHSAALSFLGFGQAPHEPSLGILLAEALRYLSHGDWWLVVFPGFMLLTLVLIFAQLCRALQQLWLGSESC